MKTEDILKLIAFLSGDNDKKENKNNNKADYYNRYSIIRTYSAGVWFGKITEREGNKVKVEDARRMFYWFCEKSISLSGCALYGIKYDKSKIISPVKSVWIEDIEIIECTEVAILSIKNAPFVEATNE